MNQPDFTNIFFNHFEDSPQKVHYELRLPPYFLHDLAFLSSLVHDARFLYKDIVDTDQKLIIPLNRDRWEIKRLKGDNLQDINSELIFTTVQNLNWSFLSSKKPEPDEELWIDYLFVGENIREQGGDTFSFVICGENWKVNFDLDKWNFTATLTDK